jgi:hypothetical protein
LCSLKIESSWNNKHYIYYFYFLCCNYSLYNNFEISESKPTYCLLETWRLASYPWTHTHKSKYELDNWVLCHEALLNTKINVSISNNFNKMYYFNIFELFSLYEQRFKHIHPHQINFEGSETIILKPGLVWRVDLKSGRSRAGIRLSWKKNRRRKNLVWPGWPTKIRSKTQL